jgi:hypothetical protein
MAASGLPQHARSLNVQQPAAQDDLFSLDILTVRLYRTEPLLIVPIN